MSEMPTGTRLRCAAPTAENICAIVVTYYPDANLVDNLKSINDQVNKIILVDNSSSASCLPMIERICIELDAHLILNQENVGVGAALNQGVRSAIDHGYAWVLMMDQDSFAYPTMVQNLVEAYCEYPLKERVGVIGANYREMNTGANFKEEIGESWSEVAGKNGDVITSGSMMAVRILEQVGPFREDFFIDLIDNEYCHRLRLAGYNLIIAPRISMQHSVGKAHSRRFLWKTITSFNHAPFRIYYRTRNALLLAATYNTWREPRWAVTMLRVPLIEFLQIFYEEDKLAKLKYALLGIVHAAVSKSGKLKHGP